MFSVGCLAIMYARMFKVRITVQWLGTDLYVKYDGTYGSCEGTLQFYFLLLNAEVFNTKVL